MKRDARYVHDVSGTHEIEFRLDICHEEAILALRLTNAAFDPFCGSGTIVSERLAYPYSQICGGDLSEEAVASSLDNVGVLNQVKIHRWDARRLPMDAGAVDKIVTNLPFGRQISSEISVVTDLVDAAEPKGSKLAKR